MRETMRDKQLNTIYSELLRQIQPTMSPKIFDDFFNSDSLKLESIENNKAVFVADSESNATMIKAGFSDTLKSALSSLLETPIEIEVTDKRSYEKKRART